MNAQPALPGCKAPERQTKARVYQRGHRTIVSIPNPYGPPQTYVAPRFADAIRYLDLVLKSRRRKA